MFMKTAMQVISMLEKKVGEDAFCKLLERIVSIACESGSKGTIISLGAAFNARSAC